MILLSCYLFTEILLIGRFFKTKSCRIIPQSICSWVHILVECIPQASNSGLTLFRPAIIIHNTEHFSRQLDIPQYSHPPILISNDTNTALLDMRWWWAINFPWGMDDRTSLFVLLDVFTTRDFFVIESIDWWKRCTVSGGCIRSCDRPTASGGRLVLFSCPSRWQE